MRVAIAAVCVLGLAACAQPARQTGAPSQAEQAADDCAAAASGTWESFQIDAHASGPDCATAQATITIRNGQATLWSESYPADRVMVLAGAASVADMQRRLSEWVDPPGAALDSTGDLPQWPAGAETPSSGEFPFYAEEGLTRARYEALRSRDAPMFCYVQGMESQACLTLENGRAVKIGVQTIPG